MRRSHAVELVARRLRLPEGRVSKLAASLADAGLITKAASRRYPPDLEPDEAVSILLAALTDDGIGAAPATVKMFSALTDHYGQTLHDALAGILRSPGASTTGTVIVRLDPPSVTMTVGPHHLRFGDETGDTPTSATLVPRGVLDAIALELAGASPEGADDTLALRWRSSSKLPDARP
ncbi:hypothetical protein ACLBXM_17055 [Xanthobacteraceae bacterium A53D]